MKRKSIKRSMCVLLSVFLVIPMLCVSAFASADTDPLDGRFYQTETNSSNAFETQGYVDGIYEHDNRFLSGYEVVDAIDVSKHQGTIDWNSVYASGIRNVMIRAGYRGSSQGTLVTDECFVQNINGALAAGLRVGIYFFTQAINENEAVEEANYVLGLIRGYGIELPVAYDCEYASGTNGYTGRFYEAKLSKEAVTANCLAFAKTIRNGGYKPMVYANPYMFSTAIYPDQISRYCQIWLAAYRSKADFAGDYSMWQYSSKGTVGGINTNVDLSYWYISQANAVDIKGLEITEGETGIAVESKSAFTAVALTGALDKLLDNYTVSGVSWRSSDEAVLAVDETGNVTAVTEGSATVTARITVNSVVNGNAVEYTYEDSRDVTVLPKSVGFFQMLINVFSVMVKFFVNIISTIASLMK